MRVPPSIGPESGLIVDTTGVSTWIWKTNGAGAGVRVSVAVPASVTTMMVALFVWPGARSIDGVMTDICVSVCERTVASFGVVPPPKSNRTRTGVLKFVPVMVTVSPPAGEPVAGVMPVTVVTGGGGQFGGHGTGGATLKVTLVVLETLLTTA